jgi:hypothetical protein
MLETYVDSLPNGLSVFISAVSIHFVCHVVGVHISDPQSKNGMAKVL